VRLTWDRLQPVCFGAAKKQNRQAEACPTGARRDTAQLNTTLASQNAAMQQDEALDRDIPTSGGNK
jgi:hypothetical protein